MNLNSFLRWSIISGVFLLLFIPLYVPDGMFFPFITGKNFAFRIVTELMLAALLILMYRDASYRPRKTWMLIALGTFVAILAVADIFGENFYRSFWSNYERMEGLISHLHFLAYFIILSVMLSTEKLWERFFQTSLGVSVFVGIHGLLQLADKAEIHQGSVRLDANLGNATYLAVYMLFHIFIAAMFMLRETTSKAMRWVYGGVMLLDLFILYHTATRGAILGLLGGALVTGVILIVLNKENLFLRKVAIGIVASVFLVVGSVFIFKDSSFMRESPVLSRFSSISLTEATTKSRFMIWNMSWQGFKEHPLLGWGQDNYILVFNKYYDPGMYAQEPWFDRSHNVFFDWLITGGILALLAYLSLFGIAFYYLFRAGNNFSIAEKSTLLGLLAGYFFQNIFVFDNLTSYILFYSVLAYITWRAETARNTAPLIAKKQIQPAPTLGSNFAGKFYAPGVIVLTLFIIYFVNIKPILASTTLIEALKPHQEGVEANLKYFEKVFSYNTFGSGEAREQLLQVALRVQGTNATIEIKQKFFDAARREMLVQVEDNPKDARYELFFATFLNRFGLYDEALIHLARARELSPKKQQILFEIGSSYLGKGDYQKALETIGEAYKSEPNYGEARFLYGVAALYAREDKLAEEALLPIYGTLLIPDDRIINAYATRGEYGKVAGLWQTRLASDPNNTQYRLALAGTYLRMGERKKAVAEIRDIITAQPEFKTQGEYFISEIEAGRNP